jgi:hypothetical protein
LQAKGPVSSPILQPTGNCAFGAARGTEIGRIAPWVNRMARSERKLVLAFAALALAACGQGEKAETPPPPEAAAVAPVEPDPSPKSIGGVTAQWQTAGDAILDDTTVRDVTFLLDGNGATIEATVTALDEPFHAQLRNNEGQVVAEADVPVGQEVQLTGQATGGDRNMVRLTREIPRSAPARFSMRIRTVRESN